MSQHQRRLAQGRGEAVQALGSSMVCFSRSIPLDTRQWEDGCVGVSQSLRRGCWWQRCEPWSDSRSILDVGPWDLLGDCPWEGGEGKTLRETLWFF